MSSYDWRNNQRKCGGNIAETNGGAALSYNSDISSIASSLDSKKVAVIYYKGTACSNDGATTRTDDTSDSDKYPAFYYAKNYRNTQTSYNSGWYLPSYAELEPLLTNYNIVLNVFKLFGMKQLDNYYEEFMSSTTCSQSDMSGASNYYNFVLGIGLEEDWLLGKGSCSKKSPSDKEWGMYAFSTAAIREF